MPDRTTAVLLDLDGTITDSAPGVIDSFVTAVRGLGLQPPPPDELRAVVGPPLAWTLEHIGGVDPADVDRGQDLYRAHYGGGSMFNSAVFDGMRQLLVALREAGVPVSLATSKSEEFARAILDHFELTGYFTAICGADDRGRNSDKAYVIGKALTQLHAAGADLSAPVMVGDREHDLEGARAHGMPCVLVAWGYGTEAEHADADALASDPAHLAGLLGLPAPVTNRSVAEPVARSAGVGR
ncbi:HAD family hydrolase [Occultella glacieicola]|uniref:HAD family hydrolase n=1 Tax=Occultella glacieicola TaxID=2518684 RepID=A0ABY2E311_9MICO|nr:HAD hydrolase-like protein [Occultella glacieicola]TDE90346.1 HAD family hydrolase [Occultella glacieicola]